MKTNESKRPNSRSSLLKSGCYAAYYTLNGYFLKIKPALAIDKVVFSFVKKGTSGNGFDIYADIDKFDLLCDDILNRELQRKLENSSLQKPAWDYTTGEKGNKTLKIFQGNNGIVINGYVVNEKLTGNVPVKLEELRIMAKWHRRVSSIYFEQMAQECIKAMKSNERFFESNTDTEGDNIPEPDNPIEKGTAAQEVPEKAAGKNNSAATGNPKNTRNPNELFVKIRTSTPVQKYGRCGNFCFKGYSKNNQEWIFVVPKENITSIGEEQWNSFYECTKEKTGCTYNIGYIKCKDRLLVTSIQNVS